MPTPSPWPELQPLAARIAVGELDGDAAIAAIVDAIVRRELNEPGTPASARGALHTEATQAVAADRVLMAMLRPVAPMRALESVLGPPPRAAAEPTPRPKARRGAVRVAESPADASVDDFGPAPELDAATYERGASGRRMTAIAGVAMGVVAGGLIWWFLLRETPCDMFARQVCLELSEPCSAGEVQQHLRAKAIDDAACTAAQAAGEAASGTAGPSKRGRAYETAIIAALGFDPRTGEPPVAAAVTERAPVEPTMLARKLPSLPSLVADEAYLYVSSGEAVLRLRSIGGQFESIATAPAGRDVAVSTDFVYWAARGTDGNDALWIDRKRGEYEPTVLATTPAKLGATHCTQGACAYVDLTDGAVWLAAQDGSAPKKLTGAQTPAPTEVWIDDREVAFAVPGSPASLVVVAVEGGAPRVVAGAEADVKRLDGDAEGLYWLASGALRTVARAGGDVTTLVPAGITTFALDPARVFVGDAAAGTIAHVPRAGGATTPVVAGQVGLEHLVVDAAGVYWTRGGELFRLPK